MQFLLLKYLFMYFSQSGHDLLYASLVSGSHLPLNHQNFFPIYLYYNRIFSKKNENDVEW
ncbi:hypothetical protein D0N41_13945 [Bacillus subtilis KCTC 1028 = ATCC 6051a]|nr:hypothetical protein D0N41_13945 [Bacillus subtilis KCTC 1028 = ATCC 6051a]